MIKHFEEVWEVSEEIAVEAISTPIDDIISLLQENKSINSDIMGEIVFRLCALSKSNDINVWKSLEKCTESYEIDLYS